MKYNECIIMKNFSTFWQIYPEEEIVGVKKVTFIFEKGKHYFICGKTGSGKSSLLLSIIHELPFNEGDLDIKGKIAYIEQNPYIFPMSIKENILFGKEFI